MKKYNEALQWVYSQVAPEVNKLYEYFREKYGLEEEQNTERQLEILAIQKKYISKTYISELNIIADYYMKEIITVYLISLENYKKRIMLLLKN